jgi:Bacterial Ig domain/Fibronectin type III domain/NHL repeat
VAVDAAGNLYISDRANQRIRKVSTSGKISTIAGVGGAGYSGDGGSAVLAKLKNPSGIAVDSAGNVFFADMGNSRIRKISASGTITTVAGTGVAHFSGDGGPAVSAAINHAEGVAVDSKGNIYISDTGNSRIRMINAAGIINTVAGTGAAGFSGDGGPAISAKLNKPVGIALDSSGKLYIADCYNNRIRVINSGNIATLAGDGAPGLTGDGGHAMSASLKFPSGVSVTAAGNVYIADWHNQCVRVINTSGTITTLAGTGVAGFSGDGTAASGAIFKYPFGLATDSKGNIFVTDSKNNRVRMIEGPSYALPVSTITSPANYGKVLAGNSGLTVTGTASAANGVSFVEVSTDGGATWNTATGTTAWSFGWKPTTNGTYLIMSRATDSGGAHESIISCSYVKAAVRLAAPGSKIANPKNGATLTASTVVIQGVAADGKGGGVVKVEVSTDGGKTWNTASGTASWSYKWTPPLDGSYTIRTRATDKAGNVEAPGTGINVAVNVPVAVNDLAPSLPAAAPGQAVTWTAAACGGSGHYKYQFLRKGPDTAGTYALMQDWSGSSSWNWNISSSSVGANSVLVNVMDSSITTTSASTTSSKGKGSKSKTYTVGKTTTSAITISSITPSVSSAVAGDTVTWTASAAGGSGSYQYEFMRMGPDTGGTAIVAKAYGASNTWSWTTTSAMAGSNTISVYVKNSDGTGEVSSTAPAYTVSPATVVPAIVVNSLVPSVASPATAGTPVTLTASATGGSGTLQYQFSRMGPDTGGSYVVTQGWGSSGSWTWSTTSSMAGTNTIMVSVRNSDGTGAVSKSAAYTVSTTSTSSNNVVLSWNPSASTIVAGYKVYMGTSSGNYTQSFTAGNVTSYTISNLSPGTAYYFAITSYDSYGNESTYSNEVSAAIP